MSDIKSIQEILDFLTQQANLRAPENDDPGILLSAKEFIIEELNFLDDLPQWRRPAHRWHMLAP
jgi:hypothetical protein